ncbi:type II secretion system F family protein [Qipengyuania sp. CAU 1752]
MLEFLATNSVARFAALALLFGLVALSVFGIVRGAVRRQVLKGELQSIGSVRLSSEHVSLQDRRETAWSKLADRIEEAGLNLTDTKPDALRDRLRAAGYPSASAPKVFTMTRLLMVFALPIAYLLLSAGGTEERGFWGLYGIPAIFALLGLYLPNLFITAKADRRREAITNGFPDCLDLLLVCVEAGLGLEAAMDRVGREMVSSHPLVAQLLSTATMQLRAGSDRETAMRKMGEASGVDEIRSFATLLIQSDKLGTSVADTLRVYANEMREKRRLRAEEKAHRLPVLISIPLVVCMLPVMIGVMMLPGVVRTVRQLIPAMGG